MVLSHHTFFELTGNEGNTNGPAAPPFDRLYLRSVVGVVIVQLLTLFSLFIPKMNNSDEVIKPVIPWDEALSSSFVNGNQGVGFDLVDPRCPAFYLDLKRRPRPQLERSALTQKVGGPMVHGKLDRWGVQQ